MNTVKLAEDLTISRIVHGQMRMADWKLTVQERLRLIEALLELGVTTLDHADIYGDYTCEALLGEVLHQNKNLRDKIRIVTKCGIMLVSGKFPGRKVKHYDYSYGHIVGSAEQSLRNFGTDRIDLLLLHRPAPFFDPAEVARALSALKNSGKVLHFGVSNFTPDQFEMLQAHTDIPLVTNQVELSPYCLEHFENGNMDFFVKNGIRPMAWSPVAGGRLLNPHDAKGPGILRVIREIGAELEVASVETVIYVWLLKHPAGVIPVAGTGRLERVRQAVEAIDLDMSLEQWYRIYVAALGRELP